MWRTFVERVISLFSYDNTPDQSHSCSARVWSLDQKSSRTPQGSPTGGGGVGHHFIQPNVRADACLCLFLRLLNILKLSIHARIVDTSFPKVLASLLPNRRAFCVIRSTDCSLSTFSMV